MKAVVYKGPENIEVEEVELPKIGKPTDAIIRITGTDIYKLVYTSGVVNMNLRELK